MNASADHPLRDQALALAGVAQFARYAHELGAEGRDAPERLERAKRAIFCTDPDTTMDVFGDLSNLGDGIAYLRTQLSGGKPDQQAATIARYIGQLLRLSGNLMKDERMLAGTIPPVYVDAVAHAERGAWPLSLVNCYERDGEHLQSYVKAAKTPEGFADYLKQHVYSEQAAA